MKHIIYILILSSQFISAQVSIETELGLPIQGYNEVRVPNSATEFDLNKDFSAVGPIVAGRIRLSYTFKEKNHISGLFAPLTINYEGQSDQDIDFQQTRFYAGENLKGTYKFNSYRLTYRRDLIKNDKWLFGLGFTAKIRDATIALSGTYKKDRKDDLGFVPLLRIIGAYQYNNLRFLIEGDGLAGGPGRAFDFFGGVTYQFHEMLSGKIGYRIVEGGADISEVYNFTIINIITAGLVVDF